MSEKKWAVFRQDFTGNEFLVEQHLSEQRARELVVEYESHKHHQHYWACKLSDLPTDYTEMLRASLNSGSSLEASLKVLRNQNATAIQCIKAICEVKSTDLAESKKIVLSSSAFSDQLRCDDSLTAQIESELQDEK
ncbi:MAG: hypothetical protein AAGA30_08220 [Planctomycetota bacterium]